MKTIRKNVFETNSSSTHAICITKNQKLDPLITHIHFELNDFGWEINRYDSILSKASYLYTAIACLEKMSLMENIKTVLDKHNITYSFEEPIYSKYGGLDLSCGYIDHYDELEDFISICKDEEKLMRYLLSSESFILTGNDNTECSININVNYDCDEFYKGN